MPKEAGEPYTKDDWVFENGLARQHNMDTQEYMFVAGEDWSNYSVHSRLRLDEGIPGSDGPHGGLVFRANEGGPFYSISLHAHYDCIHVKQYNGTYPTEVIYTPFDGIQIDANTWYDLEARLNENFAEFYLDGGWVGEIELDEQLSSGKVGLYSYQSKVSYDYILVADSDLNALLYDGFGDAASVNTVWIPATSLWTDTGIRVSAGDHIQIQMTHDSGNRPCGGDPCPPYAPCDYTWTGGCEMVPGNYLLMGKVAENGSIFAVGCAYDGMADSDGNLYIGYNDGCNVFHDNSGRFIAKIVFTPGTP
ncbi:MAG: hypothetical protein GF309_01100 [Candidatus Lokiarchaeota archaeon]|nr:hypothetical protein [Candidatus Lokiarchaeota archaeon]